MTLREAKIKALERALNHMKKDLEKHNMQKVQEPWKFNDEDESYTEDNLLVSIEFTYVDLNKEDLYEEDDNEDEEVNEDEGLEEDLILDYKEFIPLFKRYNGVDYELFEKIINNDDFIMLCNGEEYIYVNIHGITYYEITDGRIQECIFKTIREVMDCIKYYIKNEYSVYVQNKYLELEDEDEDDEDLPF